MTASCRWSTFPSLAVLVALGMGVEARPARAQACCASAGLVAPTRLRSYEDFAFGAVARARSVFGGFDAGGRYSGSGAGDSEWNLEQDLFGAARLLERGQVALMIPFIETRRTLSGVAASGGGVGDIAITARYDFIGGGERRFVPGVAVLGAVLVPTGRPPEEAGDPWAAGATGQGSWEGSLGIALEQAFEPYFMTVNVLGTLRSSRAVAGQRESFAPRFTGTVAAGRVLPHMVTLGIYAIAMRQGENNDAGGAIAGSGSSLLTAGVASTFSPTETWRIQGTFFGNIPARGWGQNQPAGAGGSLSLIRLWL